MNTVIEWLTMHWTMPVFKVLVITLLLSLGCSRIERRARVEKIPLRTDLVKVPEEKQLEKKIKLQQAFKIVQLQLEALRSRHTRPGLIVDASLFLEPWKNSVGEGVEGVWWNLDLISGATDLLGILKDKKVSLLFYCFRQESCDAIQNLLFSIGFGLRDREIVLVSDGSSYKKLKTWLRGHQKPFVLGTTEDKVFQFLSPVLNQASKAGVLAQDMRDWKRRIVTLPQF